MDFIVTADGEKIPFDKVGFQHWSNIYWFNAVFQRETTLYPSRYTSPLAQASRLALAEIDKRFDRDSPGRWRPVYPWEVELLLKMEDKGVTLVNGRIFLDGEEIGDLSAVRWKEERFGELGKPGEMKI